MQFFLSLTALLICVFAASSDCSSARKHKGLDVKFYNYELMDFAYRQDSSYYKSGYFKGGQIGSRSEITFINFRHMRPVKSVHKGSVYGFKLTVSNFTMSLGGHFLAPQSGQYVFYMDADDGAHMQIGTESSCATDSVENIEGKAFQADLFEPFGTVFNLEAGKYYPIKIVYVNIGGPAKLDISYRSPDGTLVSDIGNDVFIFEAQDISSSTVAMNTPTQETALSFSHSSLSSSIHWTESKSVAFTQRSEIVSEKLELLSSSSAKLSATLTRIDSYAVTSSKYDVESMITSDFDPSSSSAHSLSDKESHRGTPIVKDTELEPVSSTFSPLTLSGTESSSMSSPSTPIVDIFILGAESPSVLSIVSVSSVSSVSSASSAQSALSSPSFNITENGNSMAKTTSESMEFRSTPAGYASPSETVFDSSWYVIHSTLSPERFPHVSNIPESIFPRSDDSNIYITETKTLIINQCDGTGACGAVNKTYTTTYSSTISKEKPGFTTGTYTTVLFETYGPGFSTTTTTTLNSTHCLKCEHSSEPGEVSTKIVDVSHHGMSQESLIGSRQSKMEPLSNLEEATTTRTSTISQMRSVTSTFEGDSSALSYFAAWFMVPIIAVFA